MTNDATMDGREQFVPEQFVLGLSDLLESMAGVLDAVTGYRTMCLEHGFSEVGAEHMAMEYHGFVMAMMLAATLKSDPEEPGRRKGPVGPAPWI